MYFDEEFYNEPSEYDLMVEEFKESLAESVKDEYLVEMKRLKEENEELQDIKEDFTRIKESYRRKEMELEYEKRRAVATVRRERLLDLLQDNKVIMYRATIEYYKKPKCDKCDDNRKIHYKTPLGKDEYEMCDCSKRSRYYKPSEFILYELLLNNSTKNVVTWYRESSDDRVLLDDSQHLENTYNKDMDYEDVNTYSTFFKTEKECQDYCDWANER